jgi:hypothetical protein
VNHSELEICLQRNTVMNEQTIIQKKCNQTGPYSRRKIARFPADYNRNTQRKIPATIKLSKAIELMGYKVIKALIYIGKESSSKFVTIKMDNSNIEL